ncbi:hypothetical protein ANN_25838 [Periplaneta americana]|uniref:Uncharacterized protein n=1 Tax=Periplaneta americana TaxID=6978 RepID=A0ABQ8S4L8_PERAM|nr:hypothetical protein ANN_25838 [Periplaneta americana]
MDLREVGYDGRDWFNLAQDRDRRRAYTTVVQNFRKIMADMIHKQWLILYVLTAERCFASRPRQAALPQYKYAVLSEQCTFVREGDEVWYHLTGRDSCHNLVVIIEIRTSKTKKHQLQDGFNSTRIYHCRAALVSAIVHKQMLFLYGERYLSRQAVYN